MATLVSIKQRIDQLGSGEFQILCDAYLSRKGYQNIVSLGTKAGSHKTTKGTPDTYFYTDDGKYVFVEYTTQKDDLVGKIRGDINKCLDEDNTGIALSSISEIVYCHTSSNLSPRSSASLRKLCKDHGILLTLIGIDALADDLQNFPAIVKKHLQLEIDTEQILSIEDFISAYNSNALAASLNTQFAFREEELKKIDEAFETKDVVILSGTAGTGKTRLALEYARSRIAKNHDTTFFVRNHSLPIFDDLKFYFDTPRHYFLVIDDANQLSELKLVVELANKKQDGYYFKILITVLNYALQIVRERISEIARYKEIQINALTDNEIESIVKNTYGIVNPKYLERIARISEGNARIAILCGKIAVETDRLDSISDVSQLYEEYYGPVFFTAGLDATVPLQISAAVIAFLGSIHFDHIEPVLPLLMKKGIDVDSFIREVYKLHELEIVDIYHDKACSISDQCFSNYILKRVFFDQKSLGLSEMIEACFEPFRERTIQSINTLIGVFCGDSLRAFVSDEIKAAWKGHQSKTDSKYWEWVESFYPVDLVGTLLLIRDEIDNTEPVSLSADSIDLNAGINFCSVNDKIVGVLGGYANTTELDAALDLFFRYYLKRPDIFIQFYHAANMFYGIQVNSADNAFYTPINFIKKAVEYADNWNNRFILLLFVAVAQKWLDLSFSPVESGRKRNSMVIRQFSLHSAEGVSEYRTLIWEQLLIIASQGKCLETMRDIVRNYGFGNEECTYGVIQTDEPYLCRLLEMLYPPDCLEGCIIADRLDQVFSSASVTSLELSVYLKSEKLSLYQTLCGPKWIEDTSFDSHETKRNDNILAYFNSKASRIEAFDCVFDLYAELLTCENQRSYDMGRGFSYAIDIMAEEKSDYLYAAKRLIGSEDIYGIDPNYIVRKLFSFLKARDCFEMINGYKTAAINHWQFAFFNELPVNEINNSWVKELYIFFRDDSDKTIKRSGIRDLSFLKKYAVVDSNIVINISEIVFAKKAYSAFIVQLYFDFLFNEYVHSPKEVVEMYKNRIGLLEDIYLFLDESSRTNDCTGKFFLEIQSQSPTFIEKYIPALVSKAFIPPEKAEKLQVLFSLPNYILVIDHAIEIAKRNEMTAQMSFIHAFVCVPNEKRDKSDAWIRHYIEEFHDNCSNMELLFEAIAHLPTSAKKQYVTLFLKYNPEFTAFKVLPLIPLSASWTGSSIPVYSKWIEGLESLLPELTGIDFLEHKKYVCDLIDGLKARIKDAEISEIMNG